MGRTRRDTRFGLDEVDDIEAKAAREIGPGIVIGDELHARERRQGPRPARAPCLELVEESSTIGDDFLALRGRDANEGLGDARGDGDRVLGIEPVVRIGDAVRVAAFVDDALAAYFEQRDAGRRVEIGVAPAQESLLARLIDQRIEPVVIAEADAYQEVGAPQFAEIARTRLECFRIGAGRHDRFHGDEVAADRRDECGEIRCRRHHARGG